MTTTRRGRRSGGEDTRAALVDAARLVFAEQGYDGATVRAIATRAGVDAAMVNHWFGGKEGLFAAAMELPVNPAALIDGVLAAGGVDDLGERLVRGFLSVWDASHGSPLVALVRSVSSNEQAASMLRELVTHVLFGRLARRLDADRVDLRASLCATQIVGLVMVRYVVKLEPLASADADTVAAAIGPNLQRYLTGDL